MPDDDQALAATYFDRFTEAVHRPSKVLAARRAEDVVLADLLVLVRQMQSALSELVPPEPAAASHARLVELVTEEYDLLSSHGPLIMSETVVSDESSRRLVEVLQLAHRAMLEIIDVARRYVVSLPEHRAQ